MMVRDSIDRRQLLARIGELAREAGLIIMKYYQTDSNAKAKADHSPVTDADIAASGHIVQALEALTPEIAVISEEDDHNHHGLPGTRFWLVDPLDGTRSFVRGDKEFTVNIALIEDGRPVIGAIYLPVEARLYLGGAGLGAWKETGGKTLPIETRDVPSAGMTVIKSQSHPHRRLDEFLKVFPVAQLASASSSLKFCVVAEGGADLYPRFGHTMEWDTAAGHAIVESAGGYVLLPDGRPLRYGKPGFHNDEGFMVWGRTPSQNVFSGVAP